MDVVNLFPQWRKPKRYEWVTTQASPHVCDNAHPGSITPLFERWTKAGWEIVGITVFPSTSNIWMCNAIGVLRREVK
jgi:hypothetical protein